MIETTDIGKTYRIHKKAPGLKGSIKSLFHRQWEQKQALDNVSIKVGAGGIVGLIGANGAGKTTLVKILAGIIHPTAGTARVLGFDPWDRKNEFRRQIALIMGQKAQLWWDLPAGDCFLLLKEIYQIPDRKYRQSLDTLATVLGVGDLLTTQIRRLSLGERMKMELIAALLHSPRVVFLDEPTIGLDITAQRSIRGFLRNYQKQHNPAMILTSHYMDDIKNLCQRIVIIRRGEVVFDGALTKVVDEHARFKILSAQLDVEKNNASGVVVPFPDELGVVSEQQPHAIRVKVNKHRTMEGAQFILQNYPVTDLTIENEDIATIIESIQRVD
jgi:ABC-2 type transport system ATP-binding protein